MTPLKPIEYCQIIYKGIEKKNNNNENIFQKIKKFCGRKKNGIFVYIPKYWSWIEEVVTVIEP